MKPSILVIDDEKVQSIVLRKAIEMAHPEYYVESAWEEVDMLAKIENIYYHIAVIDLQMDDFKETDGLVLIHKILKINPLAKIIIISSYLSAYDKQTAEIFQTGRIIAMVDKSMEDRAFNNTIINAINTELEKQQNDSDIIKQILTNAYADAKNETNAQQKASPSGPRS